VPRPRTVKQAMRLCVGCRSDRYNQGTGYCERPGIDAPVGCDHCWSLDPAKAVYVRGAKRWVMPCHSDHHVQWLVQWARDGKKPTWGWAG
jgi:hypothetical protein